MSDFETLNPIVAEVGLRLGGVWVQPRKLAAAWTIAVGPGDGITVAIDKERDVLMLRVDVGFLNAAREAEFMKLMLTYNAAWEQTDGLRFAIDPLDGVAALHFPLPIAHADAETLTIVVQNLAERASIWADALESEGTPDAVLATDEGDDGVVFRA
ncbi:MAG: type III secretion system chaperone [Pseudomonadota bacterium]